MTVSRQLKPARKPSLRAYIRHDTLIQHHLAQDVQKASGMDTDHPSEDCILPPGAQDASRLSHLSDMDEGGKSEDVHEPEERKQQAESTRQQPGESEPAAQAEPAPEAAVAVAQPGPPVQTLPRFRYYFVIKRREQVMAWHSQPHIVLELLRAKKNLEHLGVHRDDKLCKAEQSILCPLNSTPEQCTFS